MRTQSLRSRILGRLRFLVKLSCEQIFVQVLSGGEVTTQENRFPKRPKDLPRGCCARRNRDQYRNQATIGDPPRPQSLSVLFLGQM
jgi:hypothetical protein